MSAVNAKITESLEEWVNSLESLDGQSVGVIGDWIAVICMVDVRADGTPVANYYVAIKDGNTLPHMAEGLLTRGISELKGLEEGD